LQYCRDQNFLSNRHFYPQNQLLFQPAQKFTKIVKLERVVEDMDDFLTDLGYPLGTSAPLIAPHDLERRDLNKIQESSKKEHYLSNRAMSLIEELYHEDFEIFSYERRSER